VGRGEEMGLEKLWELQELQLGLERIQQELKNPSQGKELKREKERLESYYTQIQEKKRKGERLQEQLALHENTCRSLEVKKKDTEAKLYSGQINNPSELQNLEQQLTHLNKEISVYQEKIKELNMELQEVFGWVKEHSQIFQGQVGEYQARLEEYRLWREEREREIQDLKLRMEKLEKELDEDLLRHYRELQSRLGLRALARVENGCCSGCRLMVSIILMQKIKAGERVQCENCGRLLIP